MLLLLIVMAALVSSGRPALILCEADLPQQIATRPWTERHNAGRTQSRIGVLQRMTLRVPRIIPTASAIVTTPIFSPLSISPLRCALPPPAIDRA